MQVNIIASISRYLCYKGREFIAKWVGGGGLMIRLPTLEQKSSIVGIWEHAPPGRFGIFNSQRVFLSFGLLCYVLSILKVYMFEK